MSLQSATEWTWVGTFATGGVVTLELSGLRLGIEGERRGSSRNCHSADSRLGLIHPSTSTTY
ncbi:MAG: hypothetical protein ACP5O0_09015, partial [Acidimicrobiales bacterium]